MIKKYTMIVDTDKEPFIDCSLREFLLNAEIIDFEETELSKEERKEFEFE